VTGDDIRELAARFQADMLAGFETLAREIGYRPTRFLQLVRRVGGDAAARQLIHGPTVSEGFTILALHHRLAQSVEAWVLRPEYESLFTEDDRDLARRKLTLHDFDVDRCLREMQRNGEDGTSSDEVSS